MRKTPITGDTVMELPRGAVVDVGPSDTPGWAYVEYLGQYGFASNQYLEPVGGPDKPAPPPPLPPEPTPPAPPYVPPAPPPAPTPQGPSLAAKFAVVAVVLVVVGGTTYMLLKKPSRSYA